MELVPSLLTNYSFHSFIQGRREDSTETVKSTLHHFFCHPATQTLHISLSLPFGSHSPLHSFCPSTSITHCWNSTLFSSVFLCGSYILPLAINKKNKIINYSDTVSRAVFFAQICRRKEKSIENRHCVRL